MDKRLFLVFSMVMAIACQVGSNGNKTVVQSTVAAEKNQSSPAPSNLSLKPDGLLAAMFNVDLNSPFAKEIKLKEIPSVTTLPELPLLPVDLEAIDNPLVTQGLTDEQLSFLLTNGFTVLRTGEAEFMTLREQVADRFGQPYYLTTDAAFHALHLTFDEMLKALEKERFKPRMIALLQGITSRAMTYEKEAKGTSAAEDSQMAADYLAVALRLFDPSSRFDADREVRIAKQLGQIEAASGIEESALVKGFKDDYGAYKPVGHYSGDPELEAYFKGMTWLGRVEFLFNDPEQSHFRASRAPLFITLALLETKVDLPEVRTTNGGGGEVGSRQTADSLISFQDGEEQVPAAELWGDMHEILTFLVGPGDDPGPVELTELMEGIYGSGMGYQSLLNDDQWNTFLENVNQLPAPQINSMFAQTQANMPETRGWRFMGQRFTLDAFVLQYLVFDKVGTMERPRMVPSGLDLACALGSPAARETLEARGDTTYENYPEQMDRMQKTIQAVTQSEWLSRFYDGWLYAFMAQLAVKSAEYPPYMQTSAWAYKEMNSMLGSWAELKHDTILYSKMPEPVAGGGPPMSGPPPSFVEPNPNIFYRLSYISRSILAGLEERGITISPEGFGYSQEMTVDQLLMGMDDLGTRFEELGDIAVTELRGEDPTSEDWEIVNACLGPIECNLYLMKIFGEDPEIPPMPVVAAVSGAGQNNVLEAGVGDLNRIIVIVPFKGKLVAAQGGVFSYYEFIQPRGERLGDDEWRTLLITNPPEVPEWNERFILPGGMANDALYFRTGDVYIISEEGGNPPLNLRAQPSTTSRVVLQLNQRDYVSIVDGPKVAEGYTWWKVSTEYEVEGWVVENPKWYIRSYSPIQ